MFSFTKRGTLVAAVMLAGGVLAVPASAQATRTWVSGVGDDVNPCSRTAPCKTFQGTISKTAPGGEINCIDPGGFGGVTITKAITILCDGVEAGVLITGTNAFTINAGDNDVVTISGIDMFGPTAGPGLNGVRFINGAGVNIRNSTIKGMSAQAISFEVAAGKTAFLTLDNVSIKGNGTVGDATTGGIKIAPANGATANVVITGVHLQDTVNVGLRLDLSGTTTSRINVQVADSYITNSGIGIFGKAVAGTGTVALNVRNTVIAGNGAGGVAANGVGITGRFYGSTITANGAASASTSTGVTAVNSAVLASYGNNALDGNLNNAGVTADGAFSTTIAPH
jgi:hypothetical protein